MIAFSHLTKRAPSIPRLSSTRPMQLPLRSLSNQPFVRPPSLSSKSSVALVAPAAHLFHPSDLTNGQAFLSSRGLPNTLHTDVVLQKSTYFAGSLDARAKDLSEAILNDTNDAIWAVRGGYGSTNVLGKLLDGPEGQAVIEKLKTHPKWVIGFSDLTAISLGLWSKAGCLALHGPLLTWIDKFSAPALEEVFAILKGREAITQVFEGKVRFGGADREEGRCLAKGKLVGGNLMTMEQMIAGVGKHGGEGFVPSLEGCILLVEEIDEEAYKVHRNLSTLLRAPQLQGIVGIAIGQLTNSGPSNKSATYDVYEMLSELLEPLKIPVITNLDIGHEMESARPVVLGAEVEIWSQGEMRVHIPGGRS